MTQVFWDIVAQPLPDHLYKKIHNIINNTIALNKLSVLDVSVYDPQPFSWDEYYVLIRYYSNPDKVVYEEKVYLGREDFYPS